MIDCQLEENNRYSFLQQMHIRICAMYFLSISVLLCSLFMFSTFLLKDGVHCFSMQVVMI